MQVTVRVERYADQGRCVGHIDGQVIFLRFALPGELVEAKVDMPIRSKRRFLTGEVTKVLEASADRVEPAWPLAGPLAWGGGLGGADLVHVSLPGQLKWKQATVEEQMSRIGHVQARVSVQRPDGDDELGGLNWRTRIDLIANEQGLPSMRRRESHERIPLSAMPLATRSLNDIAGKLGVWKGGFEPGSPIRIAVPQHEDEERGDNFALLIGNKVKAGRRKLTENIRLDGHNFVYEVDAAGFWQIHRSAPQLLAAEVMDAVQTGLNTVQSPVIWDLYSGAGLFTLPLTELAADACLLSIEGSRIAVAQARHNAKCAGVDSQVTALCGDVSKTIADGLTHKHAKPDAVVLDPPRSGAKAAVCRQIANSGVPLIVYVSCNPASLARDTATLVEAGYRLTHIKSYDIYPMTHHVETLAVFSK
ncbi:class I SAM-dependent RNA methyltransferase [Bombiscardovia coagulans]|uniref:RNA methyltransferase n=1 Tax=Bombiscardovia coagulans TaxID=686666 RepID=A0A261EP09_9BIFI|nr:TRAM domain-containing protein [Bombiscardovia coagulans]OZG48604.1 RNA methyltransferase [Bombiscardovia coagulans]